MPLAGGYRAACFDLDGVLIDSMPLHVLAWQQAGRRFGLQVEARAIYACEGEPGARTARLLLQEAGREAPGRALALVKAKEQGFRRMTRRASIHPELRRVLERLAARKVPMALVTGTSLSEVRRLVPAGIRRRFAVIITGDRVRHGKPHPEPYRTAFRLLKIAPRRQVVIENAPYGIRSARRAGAGRIIALASSLPRHHLREADAVTASVPALCRMIERVIDTA